MLSLLTFVEIGTFVGGSRGSGQSSKVGNGIGEDDINSFERFFDRSDIVVIRLAEFDVRKSLDEALRRG